MAATAVDTRLPPPTITGAPPVALRLILSTEPPYDCPLGGATVMRNLGAKSPRASQANFFITPDLDTCDFFWVRHDAVRRPLRPPYDGPYRVLRRSDKDVVIDRNGKTDTVSIDRVKPTYIDDNSDASSTYWQQPASGSTHTIWSPRSLVRQSIRSHRPNRILLHDPNKCPRQDLRHLLVGTVARGISTGIALSASIAAKAVIRWDTVMGSANQYQVLEVSQPPPLPVVVAVDASNHGVCAVISHTFPDVSEKAIMHASRTLTPAEKNCGQIEKEALALVFAVKKFHKLLYGRHFTLLTDHKPLLSIFGPKKGIPVYAASRLQRWATILLGYDFDIRYCHTTDFGQAVALSRLISNQREPEEDIVIAAISIEDDVRRQLSDAIRGIPVTAADIRHATEQDPVLRQAIIYVQTCWPTTALAGDLRQLFFRRASLSVVDSCLMFADRVPGIDGNIDDLVRRCSRCQQAAKMPPRQPPVPWELPERTWSRVHIDFAGPFNGVSYLILVDAYSKWPEIAPLNPATASATIAFLRRIFSQHGLPEDLVSDNDSQFISSSFEDFCHQHNIEHLRSPPYHPQSNGQAERFVDTFKRAFLKARGEASPRASMERIL
ncbi:hypothetical protein SprV_0401528100 [Sparganum proliferum]